MEPFGNLTYEEAFSAYQEQITLLAEAGADLIVIETMIHVGETCAALDAAHAACDLPIMCSMTVEADGNIFTGGNIKDAASTLEAAGADAVGINCSVGPEQLESIIRSIHSAVSIPVLAKPNAGMPVITDDGQASYQMKPETFARHMKILKESGASLLGGCCGTSNVLTGRLFDVPIKGTHAHSWVMSFPDELTAFREYARLFPDACLLLVDTYSTLKSGVPNAIKVFQEMRAAGIPLRNYGIRLDSGDLAYLSKRAKAMLEEAGFPDAVISASSDLDENLIASLKLQGAKISLWGVGTKLITCDDCPAFGGVYKLAAEENENGQFIPKIKLSNNPEKVTNPGIKKVFRIYDNTTGKIKADLIALDEETINENEPLEIYDTSAKWRNMRLPANSYHVRELLQPVFIDGKLVYECPPTMEIQAYCNREKESLWDEHMRLNNPDIVPVDLSEKLVQLKSKLIDELSGL